MCPGIILTSAGITGLDHRWCALKQEEGCSAFPSCDPLQVVATSTAELNCAAELIQLYKKSSAVMQKFIFQPYHSHRGVYPLATQTLALDKGCFSHQQYHLKHMFGSCLRSLELTFLSFNCISEKQEAPIQQHHTSFRAWHEAHQKAIGIFLLVPVGFSYRLYLF